jgi:K+-sensing histidine kinase KdpD
LARQEKRSAAPLTAWSRHIVFGRTKLPWYRRWFGRSMLDRLLNTIANMDVIVVDFEADQAMG